jgi:GNAT superfamily N-acetyltransferase
MEKIESDSEKSQAKLLAPTPLTAEHDRTDFDCGEKLLDDWLKQCVLKNESRFSRTYVVFNGKSVVAFYCLSAGAVECEKAPSKLKRNAPDSIPVSIIGRLAVSRNFAGHGLGADILSDALGRIAVACQSIGIGAVLVQAKDDRAKKSNLACAEFIEHPVDSRTLYLPIETVVAAFS